MKDEVRFLASLPVIDDITRQVCRRHRLTAPQAEDFRSEHHLTDPNYNVLRRFEGRSSLPAYIAVVINRALTFERLFLSDDAREARRAYLTIDDQRCLAGEARVHLRGLTEPRR